MVARAHGYECNLIFLLCVCAQETAINIYRLDGGRKTRSNANETLAEICENTARKFAIRREDYIIF